jgi:ABC-type glutathione transport system ATPase component
VSDALFELQGLGYAYPPPGAWLGRARRAVPALEGVELELARGETLALVGESGSGKSTLARLLLGLLAPSAGRVLYRREAGGAALDLTLLSARELRKLRPGFGCVFQDPFQSLNPRLTAGEAVAEPLRVHGRAHGRQARARVVELFARVGLEPEALARFPHEFSGGQRQRIAIARALVLSPRFVVLDEATSALDVSIRAQILDLLRELQRELGLTYLFVTHDLGLARVLAARVAVLAGGRVVESGPVAEVLARPRHAATQRLVEAVPSGDPRKRA